MPLSSVESSLPMVSTARVLPEQAAEVRLMMYTVAQGSSLSYLDNDGALLGVTDRGRVVGLGSVRRVMDEVCEQNDRDEPHPSESDG